MKGKEFKISDDIKIDILKNCIEPTYKKEVEQLLTGKKCWRMTGQVFETVSKIFVAIGGIFSFASGVFNYPYLAFVSGGISTISLAMLQFSSFSYGENKKQSQELNIILKKLNVDTMPIMERNTEQTHKLRLNSTDPFSSSSTPTPNLDERNDLENLKNYIMSIEKKEQIDRLDLLKEIDKLKTTLEHKEKNSGSSSQSSLTFENINETLTITV
jgi:hypothetical protein